MDVRPAIASDIDAAVDLAERTRRQQQKYQPTFWRKAAKSAEVTKTFFTKLLAEQDTFFLVAIEGRHRPRDRRSAMPARRFCDPSRRQNPSNGG